MSQQEILEELKQIRELLTPKPAPPPPPPKGVWAEFLDFIGKAGVLGLAIGFIMGTYIGKIVSALVSDIIMPIPGAFVSSGDWRTAVVSLPIGNGMNFGVGDFVGGHNRLRDSRYRDFLHSTVRQKGGTQIATPNSFFVHNCITLIIIYRMQFTPECLGYVS